MESKVRFDTALGLIVAGVGGMLINVQFNPQMIPDGLDYLVAFLGGILIAIGALYSTRNSL
jgi:uncharacterized membrane protein YccC